MKKILCLLLVFVLALACVSCNKDKDDDKKDDTTAKIKSVAEVSAMLSAATPTEIMTTVKYVDEDGELLSTYETYIDTEAGAQKFVFNVNRWASVEEQWPEAVKHLEGTVWKNADGGVTSTEGDAWSAQDAVGYLPETLTLKDSYFKSVEFTADNTMNAVLDSANAEKVFGVSIASKDDVNLTIKTNGTYIYEITVSYTTQENASMTITTTYDYAPVTITYSK